MLASLPDIQKLILRSELWKPENDVILLVEKWFVIRILPTMKLTQYFLLMRWQLLPHEILLIGIRRTHEVIMLQLGILPEKVIRSLWQILEIII